MEPCGNQGVTIPRCYRPYYLNLSSGDLTNTSSHICGSWYLPMFLFREGSFTFISIACLMVLAILCKLWRRIHRRIWQDFCREVQRVHEGSITDPWPLQHHWSWGVLGQFSILGREDQSIARTIKEAILIRVNVPSLNRNIGKYQLPHIWDEVLVKSPEFKFK